MADGDSLEMSNAPALRAVDEFRSSTATPETCDLGRAGFVASLVLEHVEAIRAEAGMQIERTAAGTPARLLATRLAEVERLAFAAQRLRVEALSARLRYDLAAMERLNADVFFHLSEAGEAIRLLTPVVDEVHSDPGPSLSVVDVDARAPTTSAPGRIVAAALGLDHTTAPSIVPSRSSSPPVPALPGEGEGRSVGVDPIESATGDRARAERAWTPPVFQPPEPPAGPVREWRVRRRHVRAERKLIRADEKVRGRGFRPRMPTWLSQAVATVVVVTLLAAVVIGAWMLLASGAGPF